MSSVPSNITQEQKAERFDAAYKVLSNLAFQAPEVRQSNAITVEALGNIICNGAKQ